MTFRVKCTLDASLKSNVDVLIFQTLPHNFYPPTAGLLQPAWYTPNGFPGFNPNVISDNPIPFTPSQNYPKPQGRGSGSGGNGSSGYTKNNHRGRGRGGGGMNAERNQQGDNRGTPDMRGYQATHSQAAGMSSAVTGTSNSYNSNMYPSAGAAANSSTNFSTGNYNNHYRGRDSRSSWDGSSNSSKKGSGNYNHHNTMTGNAVAPYPQPVSTSNVPSNTSISTATVTGYVSPQYYASGQQPGYLNSGAKSETSSNISQVSIQSTPTASVQCSNVTGPSPIIVSASPHAPGQTSVQLEKNSVSGSNVNPSVTGIVPSSPSDAVGHNTSIDSQGQSPDTPSNQSPSKLNPNSSLPVQISSVSSSTGNISQHSPVVVSTIQQHVTLQQSSNTSSGAHSSGSQRPTRGVSDDSNGGNGSGGYQGHNSGNYYQNYHPKSSADLNKDGPPM